MWISKKMLEELINCRVNDITNEYIDERVKEFFKKNLDRRIEDRIDNYKYMHIDWDTSNKKTTTDMFNIVERQITKLAETLGYKTAYKKDCILITKIKKTNKK